MVRPFAVVGFTLFFVLVLVLYAGQKAAAAVLAAAAVAFVICVIFKSTRRDFVLPTACISVVAACLLGMSAGLVPQEAEELFAGSEHRVRACAVSLEEKSGGRFYTVVKTSEIDGREYELKIRLSSEIPLGADPYDCIEGDFMLYNLGENSRQSRNYYLSQNVFLGGYRVGEISVFDSSEKTIGYHVLMLRKGIRDSLNEKMQGSRGALAAALLIGDRSALSDEISDDFSSAGISHLIAVSGLHLSVWCLFVLKLFSAFGLRGRLPSIISAVFVVMFMAVSGFSYSVMRAGFMMLVMLMGNVISRRADSLNSLGIAITVICFLNPYSVLNSGMQLSVLSTLGIITGFRFIKTEHRFDKNISKVRICLYKFLDFLTGLLKSTVFACAFTLPVMILSFGKVSLMSVPANMTVYLPATLCMLLSGFMCLSSFVPFLSFLTAQLASAAGACADFVVYAADAFADLPCSVIRTDSKIFSIWLAVAFVILAAAALAKRLGAKRSFKISVYVCALTFAAVCVLSFISDRCSVTVTVCDVGNGSAFLVSKGDEAALLGCGGDSFGAERNIEKAVEASGAKRLKFLLIPRISQGESSLAEQVIKNCSPEYAVAAQTDEQLEDLLVGVPHTVSPSAKLNLWEDVSLLWNTDDSQSFAVLEVNSARILLVFKPGSNIEQSADILVVREKLPNDADLSRYGLTVISADYEKGYYQQTVLDLKGTDCASTASQGNIKITISPSGEISAERVS